MKEETQKQELHCGQCDLFGYCYGNEICSHFISKEEVKENRRRVEEKNYERKREEFKFKLMITREKMGLI